MTEKMMMKIWIQKIWDFYIINGVLEKAKMGETAPNAVLEKAK